MSRFSPVRMRPADARQPDFHLLEELFKPQACLNAGRISVWVYHDGQTIREIVISGHAEGNTCLSATSILIEAAKQLDESVSWMMSCGAAYFRVAPQPSEATGWSFFLPGLDGSWRAAQRIFNEMIQALQELASEKGLVEITHQDWQRLVAFRESFHSRARASPTQIILPDSGEAAGIAAYLPIIPDKSAKGEPLIFKLEGWDYDCPAFQLVSDHHLRSVQRELLGDALRRRRTYRGWLKEWMEDWVQRLSWLPKVQATSATLEVSEADAEPSADPRPVTAAEFLNDHARSFLDRGQRWHQQQAYLLSHMSFNQLTSEKLDEQIRPDRITEVDFERGHTREREATTDDASYSKRERILVHDPQLISQCLLYIRRMDSIIKPYEDLRLRWETSLVPQTAQDETARQAQMVSEISRRIVIETMVRGWPSIYLTHEQDSAEFDAWAANYRSHVWAIMARQAKSKGVALEILLEENVIYDVRFNDDLGCTIQPLMLTDDFTHAQLHGSRAGASVVVPIWFRRQSHDLPAEVLSLGATNSERAAQLVKRAARETTGNSPDAGLAAESLRLALACHPGVAGKLILQEWSRRLGRDTSREFANACNLVTAAELLSRHRYSEAKRYVEDYLQDEPHPVADAFVIAAMIELERDEVQRIELRNAFLEYEQLTPRHEELLLKLRPSIDRAGSNLHIDIMRALQADHIPYSELERLLRLQNEIERVGARIQALRKEVEEHTRQRRRLIEKSLDNPSALGSEYPALAQAATKANEVLTGTLDHDCLYRQWSEVMVRRYVDIRRIVEVRGLLDILYALSLIALRIEQSPNQARRQALDEMQQLSLAIWLPNEIEHDLRNLAEEFEERKGDWDRLQSLQIVGVIRDAISTCLSRMQDLLSSNTITHLPLKEGFVTRIHITQTIETKYQTALDMLLEAKVAFGAAIQGSWVVRDYQVTDIPEGGRLRFDKDRGTILLESGSERTPLLQAEGMSQSDIAFVVKIFADPELPFRFQWGASCLAEELLAVQVEPREEWCLWRDAMARLPRELITALSSFGYEANLMPEHAPPLKDSAGATLKRMDELTPHGDPTVDWSWTNLDAWQKLVGRTCQRLGPTVTQRAAGYSR